MEQPIFNRLSFGRMAAAAQTVFAGKILIP